MLDKSELEKEKYGNSTDRRFAENDDMSDISEMINNLNAKHGVDSAQIISATNTPLKQESTNEKLLAAMQNPMLKYKSVKII